MDCYNADHMRGQPPGTGECIYNLRSAISGQSSLITWDSDAGVISDTRNGLIISGTSQL